MKSELLSRKFHSRGAAIITVAVAALYAGLSGGLDNVLPAQGDQGIALPSPSSWNLAPTVSLIVNVGLNLLIMVLMMMLNRAYNVLRAITYLPVGLFAVMQAAVPRQVLFLNSGTVVAVVITACLFMMFSTYSRPDSVRTVYTVFLLLSAGLAAQYCFLLFVPVFWIICIQMRVMGPRAFLASLMGVATVWIILFGTGIVTVADVRLPRITNIFEAIDMRSALYLLTATAVTAFMLLSSVLANVLKTIAYNARARAYNGALVLVAVAAVAAMALDYDNLLAYLPLLNVCAAYQITHYFVNHRYERQYIAVLAIVGVYVALYLWRLSL